MFESTKSSPRWAKRVRYELIARPGNSDYGANGKRDLPLASDQLPLAGVAIENHLRPVSTCPRRVRTERGRSQTGYRRPDRSNANFGFANRNINVCLVAVHLG